MKAILFRYMRYDIEADWKLLDSCNYRCAYCFWPPEMLGRKLAGLPKAAEWIEAFARSGRTWLIHISGGEPAIHPEFADLCAGLTERHYLSINSNLSRDSIAEMARRVPPERVTLVHGAIHPEERERRHGWAIFVRNVAALRERGHPVVISVVMTPEVLVRFEAIAAECEAMGLRPVPKLLRGGWQGRVFPSGYSREERAVLRKALAWARVGYAHLLDGRETPTVWPLDDADWLGRRLDFRGRSCDAGRRFVSLYPDGAAYACGEDGYLGNLIAGDFAARTEPEICRTSYCFYYCRKYSHEGFADRARSALLTGEARPVLTTRAGRSPSAPRPRRPAGRPSRSPPAYSS